MMSRRALLQSTAAAVMAGATLEACAKQTLEPILHQIAAEDWYPN